MKHLFISALVLIFTYQFFYAQNSVAIELISSSGNNYVSNNASICFSIGELAISKLHSSENILTQGFQQTKLPIIPNRIFPVDNTASIEIYPNPANDIFYLNIKENTNSDYILSIYNLLGKKVMIKKLNNGINSISVHSLISTIYMLEITSLDQQLSNYIKISIK